MRLQGQTKDGISWIHLQSIGKVEAKPAIKFKPGDKMMWNWGYRSEVIEVVSETAKTIIFKLKDEPSRHDLGPYIVNRRFKKTTLVAIG